MKISRIICGLFLLVLFLGINAPTFQERQTKPSPPPPSAPSTPTPAPAPSNNVADDQPQKKVMNFLAIMDLRCGKEIEKDQCAALTDVAIDELVKLKKYTVIDRANRDKILAEAGFQQTGCVDNSCTIEMGRQLGVGKLVAGSITKIGETYLINLQLLNVETAAVETSARERCDKCKQEDLIDTVTNAVRKLMGETPVPTPATTPSPATPGLVQPQGANSIESLIRAIQDGNVEQVKLIVKANPALINTRYYAVKQVGMGQVGNLNAFPLCFAARSGKPETVKFLLENGADIKGMNVFEGMNYKIEDSTALHCVVGTCGDTPVDKQLEIAAMLINSGADVNAKSYSKFGITKMTFTPISTAKMSKCGALENFLKSKSGGSMLRGK